MTEDLLQAKPPFRKLRGYAFDPSTSLDLETAQINQLIYKVPWEDDLKPGPEGDYIKVIDRDPASDAFYLPVDLNKPDILASEGLTPSETNPQFHQQMVYAVIMTTIKNFEKALGRKIMWSPEERQIGRNRKEWRYVDKLLVFPHGFRDQNAYYTPDRKALLFGYYNATPQNAGLSLPGGIVYSCLSHDIIAHETTHALLDGMYSRYMEITHPDVAGFHEGFSDIVALLQHFTHPEIVRNQIARVRGRLDTENLLAKLAVEFGQSTGEYRSLRDAIGKTDEHGNWIRNQPHISDYDNNMECHDRGALLVSAVFDAFIAIYSNRTADLLRIATGGTGVLPTGEIHPDLVGRLADEASKAASHVLNMCVRALDYCPPVDLNYGDFLRAVITADKELIASDDQNYRIAFINAFRKRGIFPEGVPNLSVDTLCYNPRDLDAIKAGFAGDIFIFLRQFKERLAYKTKREEIFLETQAFIRGNKNQNIKGFHESFFDKRGVAKNAAQCEDLTGLVFSQKYRDFGIGTGSRGGPAIEISSLKIHNRTGPDGQMQNQIIMSLVQSCTVSVKEKRNGDKVFKKFRYRNAEDANGEWMRFRGGCTLIFDLNDLTLRHAITKPIFDPCHIGKKRRTLTYNTQRLNMQYRSTYGDLYQKMEQIVELRNNPEIFASLHQPKHAII